MAVKTGIITLTVAINREYHLILMLEYASHMAEVCVGAHDLTIDTHHHQASPCREGI